MSWTEQTNISFAGTKSLRTPAVQEQKWETGPFNVFDQSKQNKQILSSKSSLTFGKKLFVDKMSSKVRMICNTLKIFLNSKSFNFSKNCCSIAYVLKSLVCRPFIIPATTSQPAATNFCKKCVWGKCLYFLNSLWSSISWLLLGPGHFAGDRETAA